jgi:two-component system, cell cycle sensor histidine kinase and response regulator CckA
MSINTSEELGSRGLDSVLDAVPGAWFFTRRDGSFAYVSLGACAWLGYSRAEVLELRIFDIDPAVTPGQWEGIWSTTKPPDALTIRTIHRRKDGSRSPVEVRACRAYIDGEDLAVSYSVDLTQSEQTRAALITTQAELKRLLDHLPDLVFRISAKPVPQFSFVSPSSAPLLGYTPEELVGTDRSLESVIHPDDLSEFLSSDPGKAGVGRRIRFLHRRGHVVWTELRAIPLASADEGNLLIEGVARDITETYEREQLQEQLHQAQKLEAVGQLAGGIAHDFNNLLQVISGNTQLARAQHLDRRVDNLLAGVMGAAERASSLIKQLLAFSRKGAVDFVDLELDQIVSSLHRMLERLMGEHIRLSCECKVRPLHVFGNAAQLEQLVVNLCINARDALPRGGNVRLVLDSVLAGELPWATRSQMQSLGGSFARLTISDDGEGMSAEVLTRMYEPFFTTKGPGKGTGLGLSTAYAVVQTHGGVIDVTSSPGQGSTFRILLPSVTPASTDRTPPALLGVIRGEGRLALAAEDEPEVLRLTAAYLSNAGFEVLCAQDGEQAEALLMEHQHKLSVAVLDVVMPIKSGPSIHASLRERGIHIPIVFVTGYDDEALVATMRQKGVAVLRKPFSPQELLAKVALVVTASR